MTAWHLNIWTVSWKPRLSCRHVTIKRNVDSFQTGYIEKTLISLKLHLRAPPRAFTCIYECDIKDSENVTRGFGCLSHHFSRTKLQTFSTYQGSESLPKPSTVDVQKAFFVTYLKVPSRNLSPLGQPCCFSGVTPRESHKADFMT